MPPVDVSTTGNASGYVPEPVATAPQSWSQNPYVQTEGGFVAGIPLGVVPFAAVGQQALDAGGVLPQGTPEARRSLAVGQIFGGIVTFVGGLGGEALGGFVSSTGLGAAVGVPAIVVSTGLVAGGAGNIVAGVRGLLTTGSGSSGPAATAPATEPGKPDPKPGSASPQGAGKAFPDSVKEQARQESGNRCVFCGTDTTNKPGPTRSEIDHSIPRSRGGNNSIDNAQNTCRTCNRQKGARTSQEFSP